MPSLRGFLLAVLVLAASTVSSASAPPPGIRPVAASGYVNGQARTTVDGKVIDAHDGEIRQFNGLNYLYGTAYGCGFRWTDASSPFCGFNVYTSPDLVSWSGPQQLFDPGPWQATCMHSSPPGWGCFRPRVLYNAAAARFVLWVNVPGGYRALTSPTPQGPFVLAGTPAVSGGDMGLFQDSDGSAYLNYSSGGREFERRLTADYLDVTGATVELTGFPQVAPFYGAESPALFARNGVYYTVLSVPRCPYCGGTGAGYFMGASAMGPWTYIDAFSDYSCNGQVTAVTEVQGAWLFQSDQWLQTANEYAAHQFWGPLEFEGARIKTLSCDVGAYPERSYFSWYDNSDPNVHGVNLHLVNPGTAPVSGALSVPGQILSFTIAPGQEWIGAFRPGTSAGPVEVGATGRVIASMRTQYGDSFSEVPAQPAGAAATDLYFTWFDRISSPGFRSDNVHVVNPGTSPATVTVTIPGQPGCTVNQTLSPGAEGILTCPTGFGGPVRVHADHPVLASQRTVYYQSFNEVVAQPAGGGTSLLFAWYDHASSTLFTGDNVHVIATSGSLDTANVRVTVPSCPDLAVTRFAPSEWIYSCPFGEGFGGPVTVLADQPVLASQRVQYGSSFNEVSAQDASRAGTSLTMPWFDFASSGAFTGDNIHVLAPAGTLTPGAVTVGVPGCAPGVAQVSAAELVYSCPRGTGFGGPVTISSTVPVLASQRVQYLQSFNEALATSTG